MQHIVNQCQLIGTRRRVGDLHGKQNTARTGRGQRVGACGPCVVHRLGTNSAARAAHRRKAEATRCVRTKVRQQLAAKRRLARQRTVQVANIGVNVSGRARRVVTRKPVIINTRGHIGHLRYRVRLQRYRYRRNARVAVSIDDRILEAVRRAGAASTRIGRIGEQVRRRAVGHNTLRRLRRDEHLGRIVNVHTVRTKSIVRQRVDRKRNILRRLRCRVHNCAGNIINNRNIEAAGRWIAVAIGYLEGNISQNIAIFGTVRRMFHRLRQCCRVAIRDIARRRSGHCAGYVDANDFGCTSLADQIAGPGFYRKNNGIASERLKLCVERCGIDPCNRTQQVVGNIAAKIDNGGTRSAQTFGRIGFAG